MCCIHSSFPNIVKCAKSCKDARTGSKESMIKHESVSLPIRSMPIEGIKLSKLAFFCIFYIFSTIKATMRADAVRKTRLFAIGATP